MDKEKYNILRIKEVAEGLNITIKAVAKRAGLSYTYTSEVSRGIKLPKVETLVNIAKALNVDIRDLFMSTKENKTNTELIEDVESIMNELKTRLSDEV